MSDETEAQPEAGEGRARRARKPKAAAAEAWPVENPPEVVVTVSGNALPSADDIRDALRTAAAHAEASRARPAAVGSHRLDLAPFRAYVARVPGWGPLHCVLHDGSVADDAVLRAQQDARALRDAAALELAELLGALDQAGRLAVREALHSP